MAMQTFDFSEGKEFEVKTKSGSTVLNEPSPDQYFNYLKRLESRKKESDMKELYEIYIEYFALLGGDEKILRELKFSQLLQLAQALNGGDEEKK